MNYLAYKEYGISDKLIELSAKVEEEIEPVLKRLMMYVNIIQ